MEKDLSTKKNQRRSIKISLLEVMVPVFTFL
jgi:hypothetical protein